MELENIGKDLVCPSILVHSYIKKFVYRNKHIKFKNNIAECYGIRGQLLFYKHEHGMVRDTVPNMNKITNLNGYNYSNLAHSEILFYMHKQPMVPNRKKIHPPSWINAQEWMDIPDPFLHSPIPLRQSGE